MPKFWKTTLILVVCLAGSTILFFGLGDAIVPLLLSFFLAYFTYPLIRRLEQKGLPRNFSVSIVFTFILLVLLAVFALVLPKLISETRDFVSELPRNAEVAASKIEDALHELGYSVDLDPSFIIEYFEEHASEFSLKALQPFGNILKKGVSGVLKFILTILNIFLFPMFFFYVISDYEKIAREISQLIPPGLRESLKDFENKANDILSGYIRGQMGVAGILALLYSFGLWAVGLKFGFVIGLLAGILSIIPYAGFTLGFASALIVGLANFSGPGPLIGIGGVFIVVQALEGFVITPKLVGDKVGLSSFATILALIIGGNLFGFVGVLLAIPVAGILKKIAPDIKEIYFNSPYYMKN